MGPRDSDRVTHVAMGAHGHKGGGLAAYPSEGLDDAGGVGLTVPLLDETDDEGTELRLRDVPDVACWWGEDGWMTLWGRKWLRSGQGTRWATNTTSWKKQSLEKDKRIEKSHHASNLKPAIHTNTAAQSPMCPPATCTLARRDTHTHKVSDYDMKKTWCIVSQKNIDGVVCAYTTANSLHTPPFSPPDPNPSAAVITPRVAWAGGASIIDARFSHSPRLSGVWPAVTHRETEEAKR